MAYDSYGGRMWPTPAPNENQMAQVTCLNFLASQQFQPSLVAFNFEMIFLNKPFPRKFHTIWFPRFSFQTTDVSSVNVWLYAHSLPIIR